MVESSVYIIIMIGMVIVNAITYNKGLKADDLEKKRKSLPKPWGYIVSVILLLTIATNSFFAGYTMADTKIYRVDKNEDNSYSIKCVVSGSYLELNNTSLERIVRLTDFDADDIIGRVER